MKRSLVLFGSILLVAGVVLGYYASQRNCLIAFITKGDHIPLGDNKRMELNSSQLR